MRDMSNEKLHQMSVEDQDSQAMDELRRRFRGYAVETAKRLGLDEESAEDALNHWLLRLKRFTRYDGFKPWSYKVIRNRLIDIQRQQKRRNRRIVGEIRVDVAAPNQNTVRRAEIPPDDRLYQAAEELVQCFRYELLWLFRKELLDTGEKFKQARIAKMLGVHQSTISRRIRDAKRRIEEYIRCSYPDIYADREAREQLCQAIVDLCRRLLLSGSVSRTMHSGGDDNEAQ